MATRSDSGACPRTTEPRSGRAASSPCASIPAWSAARPRRPDPVPPAPASTCTGCRSARAATSCASAAGPSRPWPPRVGRRPRLDLYHSALEVRVREATFVIEQAPVPDGRGERRGVVAEGPVGTRRAGRLRIFRYEIRRWPGGEIPDVDEAVESPRRLADGEARARRVLDQVPRARLRCGVATTWRPARCGTRTPSSRGSSRRAGSTRPRSGLRPGAGPRGGGRGSSSPRQAGLRTRRAG